MKRVYFIDIGLLKSAVIVISTGLFFHERSKPDGILVFDGALT